jgi:hypothetical protein
MAKRTLFVLTFIAILLSSPAITVAASQAERAAANCINKPNAAAPQGSHWFYSVDRETHRQCWFLGPEKMNRRQIMARVRLPVPKPVPPATSEIPVETVAGGNEITAAFSTRWPESQQSASAFNRKPMLTSYHVHERTTTELQNDIVPVLTVAALLPASAERFDHIFVALGAALAFAAIFSLTIFKHSGMSGRNVTKNRVRPGS